MSIDWDKPLVIKTDGKELSVEFLHKDACGCWMVAFEEASWAVRFDGMPTVHWMPLVYNKKPVPKAGEWWMCEIVNPIRKYPHIERVLKWGDDIDRPSDHITPLYKMERVKE